MHVIHNRERFLYGGKVRTLFSNKQTNEAIFYYKNKLFSTAKNLYKRIHYKHASGTHCKPTFFACFPPPNTQTKERIREIFKKIGRAWLHPFPLFLFLLSLSTANGKHYLPTALHLFMFHLFVCRSLHTQIQRILRSFLCFALFLRFSALCGFIFAFGAFLSLFLFPPKPTHPTPISRYRISGYPIP